MNSSRGWNKHLFLIRKADVLICFCFLSLNEYIFRWLTHHLNRVVFPGMIFCLSLIFVVAHRLCHHEKCKVEYNVLTIYIYGILFAFQAGESTLVHCTTGDIFTRWEIPITYLTGQLAQCLRNPTPTFCYCQFISVTNWILFGLVVCVGTNLRLLVSLGSGIVVTFIAVGCIFRPHNFWSLWLPRLFFFLLCLVCNYQAFYFMALQICRIRHKPQSALAFLPSYFFTHIEPYSLRELPREMIGKKLTYEEHLFFLLRVIQCAATRGIAMKLITETNHMGEKTNLKNTSPDELLRSAVLWYHMKRHRKHHLHKYLRNLSTSCPFVPVSRLMSNLNRLHPYVTHRVEPNNSKYCQAPRVGWHQHVLDYSFSSIESEQNHSLSTDNNSELLNVLKKNKNKWIPNSHDIVAFFIRLRIAFEELQLFRNNQEKKYDSFDLLYIHRNLSKNKVIELSTEQIRSPRKSDSGGLSSPYSFLNTLVSRKIRKRHMPFYRPTFAESTDVPHCEASVTMREKKKCPTEYNSHQFILNIPSRPLKETNTISLVGVQKLSTLPLFDTVKERICLYNELLGRTINHMARPILIDVDTKIIPQKGLTPLSKIVRYITQLMFWLRCVEVAMLKAQWKKSIETPQKGFFSHFVDRKVERWFLAWSTTLQMHQYILLYRTSWIIMLGHTFMSCHHFIMLYSGKIVPKEASTMIFTPPFALLLLILRVSSQLILSGFLLWSQNNVLYTYREAAHRFKRRAFLVAFFNLVFGLLDIYVEILLFPTVPISLYNLVLVGMTFPVLSQVSVGVNALVSLFMTLMVLCVLPLLHLSLYNPFAIFWSLMNICISLSVYFCFVSGCITMNYGYLFSRYLLPYLLYIDALTPFPEAQLERSLTCNTHHRTQQKMHSSIFIHDV